MDTHVRSTASSASEPGSGPDGRYCENKSGPFDDYDALHK